MVLHQFSPVRHGCINFSSRVNLKLDFHCLEMLYTCVCLQIFVFNSNENLIASSVLVNIFYWIGWGPSSLYIVYYTMWFPFFFFSFCFNKYALLSSLLLAQNLPGMCDFSLCQLLNSFLLHDSSGSFLLLFPQMFLGRMHNSPAEVKRSALWFLNGVGIAEQDRTSLAPCNIYTQATQNSNWSFFSPRY